MVPEIDNILKDWGSVKLWRVVREKPFLMLVDDDAMIVKLVSHVLKKKYNLMTATSGREAVVKHLEAAPDVILLDIGLPDCNGLALLNYIRKYDEDCQILMFSWDSYLKARVRALSEGAPGFVSKPYNPRIFESFISRWAH